MAPLMEGAHHMVLVGVEVEHREVLVVVVILVVVVDQVTQQEGVVGVIPQMTLLVDVTMVTFHSLILEQEEVVVIHTIQVVAQDQEVFQTQEVQVVKEALLALQALLVPQGVQGTLIFSHL